MGGIGILSASLIGGPGLGYDKACYADEVHIKADSFIPMTMAGIYLLLLIYFKTIGGYKAVKIDEQTA